MMKQAMIYGVGVGIGDPEMMTLKAIRVLRESDVICLPRLRREDCRAYKIAVQVLPELEQKEILCFDFEMIRDKEKLMQRHQEIYAAIKEEFLQDKSIAFLTIGDPAVYSTFCYIAKQAAADDICVEWIDGIPSFCACAASLGISLCDGEEELHVFPGIDNMEEALRMPGTKVFMKCGRGIPVLKEKLLAAEEEYAARGRKLLVYGVAECAMPEEEIFSGAGQLPEDGRYMMTVIVKEAETGG